jgi:hypothetical protein
MTPVIIITYRLGGFSWAGLRPALFFVRHILPRLTYRTRHTPPIQNQRGEIWQIDKPNTPPQEPGATMNATLASLLPVANNMTDMVSWNPSSADVVG